MKSTFLLYPPRARITARVVEHAILPARLSHLQSITLNLSGNFAVESKTGKQQDGEGDCQCGSWNDRTAIELFCGWGSRAGTLKCVEGLAHE